MKSKKVAFATPDLSRFSINELCEIYNTLDHWEWPEKLGEKPDGWDSMPRHSERKGLFNRFKPTKLEVMRPIRDDIKFIVGQKRLLEYQWIHNLGESKEAFQEWYDARISNYVFSPWVE